jgi:hypothetical protein
VAEQQLGEVGTVLTADPGDQRAPRHRTKDSSKEEVRAWVLGSRGNEPPLTASERPLLQGGNAVAGVARVERKLTALALDHARPPGEVILVTQCYYWPELLNQPA